MKQRQDKRRDHTEIYKRTKQSEISDHTDISHDQLMPEQKGTQAKKDDSELIGNRHTENTERRRADFHVVPFHIIDLRRLTAD